MTLAFQNKNGFSKKQSTVAMYTPF